MPSVSVSGSPRAQRTSHRRSDLHQAAVDRELDAGREGGVGGEEQRCTATSSGMLTTAFFPENLDMHRPVYVIDWRP